MNAKQVEEAINQKLDFYFGSSDTTMDQAQETIFEMSKMIYTLKKDNDAMAQILSSID